MSGQCQAGGQFEFVGPQVAGKCEQALSDYM